MKDRVLRSLILIAWVVFFPPIQPVFALTISSCDLVPDDAVAFFADSGEEDLELDLTCDFDGMGEATLNLFANGNITLNPDASNPGVRL